MASGKYSKVVAEKVCGKMKSELEKGSDIEPYEPSPTKKDTKELNPVVKANSWEFDPAEILDSPRKVKGTFHVPKVDKDKEIITTEAMTKAIPDFMHLPILHDFHKERVLGVVTKVWEESDAFHFEALFKATHDVDDAWAKVQKGEYDHVSIFGARLKGNPSCGLNPNQRAVPCISEQIRLDSISACDVNARNDETSLSLAKAFYTDENDIIKALSSDSGLSHGIYDGPETKTGGKKGDKMKTHEADGKDVEDDEEKEEVEKSEERIPLKEEKEKKKVNFTGIREAKEGDKKVEKCSSCDAKKDMLHKAKEGLTGIYSMLKELIHDDKKMVEKDEETHAKMEKADEDEEINDESEENAEKEGKRRFKKGGTRPKVEEEPAERGATSQPVNKDIEEKARDVGTRTERSLKENDEARLKSRFGINQRKDRSEEKKAFSEARHNQEKPSRKIGAQDRLVDRDLKRWSEEKKAHEGKPWSQKPGQESVGNTINAMRADTKWRAKTDADGDQKRAGEGMRNLHKGERPKVEEEPAEHGSTSQKNRKDVEEVEKGDSTEMKQKKKQFASDYAAGKVPKEKLRGIKDKMLDSMVSKGDNMTDVEESDKVIVKANLTEDMTDEQFVDEIVKARLANTDEIVKAEVKAQVDEIRKAMETQIAELKAELTQIKEQPMVKAAVLIPEGDKVDAMPLNYEAFSKFMQRS